MQTDQPTAAGSHRLLPHPAHPPLAVQAIGARVLGTTGPWLQVRWRIEGVGHLTVPPFAGRGRAEGLWRTTCFELFVRPGSGPAYIEFNFSPSERWAAYDFDAPREGMRDRPMPRDPVCTFRAGRSFAIFDAALPLDALPQENCALSLTAVIEERGEGGAPTRSYWALAHHRPQPDFHDPACFTATLPAPGPA